MCEPQFIDDLRRHAHATPAKLALTTPDGAAQRTYAELDAAADAWARWFRSIGLRTGDSIALLLENRLEVVEIWWAARRAGLYYIPLSTHLRQREILYVLRDSNVRLLITSAQFAVVAAGVTRECAGGELPHRIILDGAVDGFLSTAPERWADLPELPPQTLYGRELIYSSGTTGLPKGIRRALAPYAQGDKLPSFEKVVRKIFRSRQDMVYLSTCPLYHAIGRFLMRATEAGGTGVVMHAFDPEDALAAIERFRVTHTLWVPTMFVRLLALPEPVRRRYDVLSLELVLHGAAPCPDPVKRRMIEWFGPTVEEFYGGTENAGVTHISTAEWLDRPGSVGRSVAGRIHIIAEDGSEAELPVGDTGLVYFEGSVPFTYQNDAGKSREAFTSKGWGTYGDIGRVDSDGYLYLSDRRTDLIISGGVNIYPGEVETVLSDHPAISEVAVVGISEPEFGQQVTAAICLAEGHSPNDQLAQAIVAWCRERMAGLKCPRKIHFVDELPRNEHGKLLKRQLRDRFSALAEQDRKSSSLNDFGLNK